MSEENTAAEEPAPAPEPAPLPPSVTVIEDGDRTIYVLGTAHVSQRSVEEVREIIEQIRPDTVCVELCQARYEALTDNKRWQDLDIFEVIKGGKTLFLLASVALAAYQRRIGDELGVRPGAELLAGVEAAEAVGARLVLADRDVNITLKRTWANVSFWRKMELLSVLVASLFTRQKVDSETIEELKEQAQLSKMLEEFAELMPSVKGPLIDERDRYLMSSVSEAPGEKVVAVVGAAHVPGMRRQFGTPVDREALEKIPPRRRWVGLLKWIIPALILAAFAYGYVKHEGETFEQMLWAWILPNSVMCAVLTTVALAKPLSILTAFVASPITSLNPLLGAGMVVGLLEAWLRKPTVSDCERINEDARTVKGFYKNQFTRVLLVAVMSTLGSALGAWIGLSWVVALVV